MESPKIVVSKQPTVFDKLKEYYKLHPVVAPKDHGIKPINHSYTFSLLYIIVRIPYRINTGIGGAFSPTIFSRISN